MGTSVFTLLGVRLKRKNYYCFGKVWEVNLSAIETIKRCHWKSGWQGKHITRGCLSLENRCMAFWHDALFTLPVQASTINGLNDAKPPACKLEQGSCWGEGGQSTSPLSLANSPDLHTEWLCLYIITWICITGTWRDLDVSNIFQKH